MCYINIFHYFKNTFFKSSKLGYIGYINFHLCHIYYIYHYKMCVLCGLYKGKVSNYDVTKFVTICVTM